MTFKGLNLKIDAGKTVTLAGPSGSGKATIYLWTYREVLRSHETSSFYRQTGHKELQFEVTYYVRN
jgi:ATP-binding cassette subfamily B (MDR/TAP) protein 1